jgi:hypothetical protein
LDSKALDNAFKGGVKTAMTSLQMFADVQGGLNP